MTLQNLVKILDKYDSGFDVTTASNQLILLNRLLFYDWHNSQNTKACTGFSYCISKQVNGNAKGTTR
jgi:hypothetical protein